MPRSCSHAIIWLQNRSCKIIAVHHIHRLEHALLILLFQLCLLFITHFWPHPKFQKVSVKVVDLRTVSSLNFRAHNLWIHKLRTYIFLLNPTVFGYLIQFIHLQVRRVTRSLVLIMSLTHSVIILVHQYELVTNALERRRCPIYMWNLVMVTVFYIAHSL